MHILAMFAGVVAVLLAVAPSLAAETKKKTGPRSDYTAERLEKVYSQALEACRKACGMRLSRVHVDYRRKRYVCYIY